MIITSLCYALLMSLRDNTKGSVASNRIFRLQQTSTRLLRIFYAYKQLILATGVRHRVENFGCIFGTSRRISDDVLMKKCFGVIGQIAVKCGEDVFSKVPFFHSFVAFFHFFVVWLDLCNPYVII